MKLKIAATQDGSTTILREDLQEHYHSVYGAIQETEHVYIRAGFEYCKCDNVRVLEVGFGTGLNTLLTFETADLQKRNVQYHSIEKYPLDMQMVAQLDFGIERNVLLHRLHMAAWNTNEQIAPHFVLRKIHADLLTYNFSEKYHLIYYDAFAPDKQAEMWSPKVLQKVANTLETGGVLTTYSTKGVVKQAFRDAGLFVKRLQGAKGKRDMLRCIKV